MTNAAGKPVFGSPDFWTVAHNAFPKFFEVAPRVQDALNGLTQRGYADVEPCHRVVLNLTLLTGVSMMELVTLAGNGLGHGAMKIARSMLEYAINAEYLRSFPGACDTFLLWHWVEQHKLLTYMGESDSDLRKHVSQEKINEIEKEFDRVRAMFEYQTGSGKTKTRSSWCSLDLASRAAKTGFGEPYRIVYPMTSQILHGSIGGLAMHFDLSEDDDRIAVPPSLDYCDTALVGGHMCVVKVVETFSKTFDVQPDPPLEELVRDYHYAWGKRDEKAQVPSE